METGDCYGFVGTTALPLQKKPYLHESPRPQRRLVLMVLVSTAIGCHGKPARPDPDRLELCRQADAFIEEPLTSASRTIAEGAIRACEDVLEARLSADDEATAQYGLGALLQFLGRSDAAIIPLSRAIALRPTDAVARARLGRSYLVLGYGHQARENVEEAQKAFQWASNQFEIALDQDSDGEHLHWNLGLALWELEQTDRAFVHLIHDLNLSPTEQHAVDLAARMNNAERYQQAAALLEAAESYAPNLLERNDVARQILDASRRGQRWSSDTVIRQE